MNEFRPNPRFVEQVAASPPMRSAMTVTAGNVADEATSIATSAGHTYETQVHTEGDSIEIRGRTQHAQGVASIASWLEYGADGPRHIPALAPLRNAAMKFGLKLKGRT